MDHNDYSMECFAQPLLPRQVPRPPQGKRFCGVCLTPFTPRTVRHKYCCEWCSETGFEVRKVLHRERLEREKQERFALTGSTRRKRRKRRRKNRRKEHD